MLTDFSRLTRAFPDFPVSSLPEIPDSFVDASWRNDSCPQFIDEARGLSLFIDYPETSQREYAEGARFSLHKMERHGPDWVHPQGDSTLAESNDFAEILRACEAFAPTNPA